MYYITELNEAALNMLWSLSVLLKHILIKKKNTTPILARQKEKISGCVPTNEKKEKIYLINREMKII